MGHVTGFLDNPRVGPSYAPVSERLRNWKEFHESPTEEELGRQGARCMDCGIPYCHTSGCPVYNLIPEWNDLVYKGEWKEAFLRLEATNNLPEITGRVCPAPCETSCTLAVNSSPVTIKEIELAIIEKAFAFCWVVPRPPAHLSGRSVAVVGSGPAGLSAAQELRRAGHNVTVFERSARVGGLLRYGIPDYKLEKRILDRRVRQMEAEGIRFETGVSIGDDLSAHYLRRSFNAILLAMGAGEPRDLKVTGRELPGILFAMDYLTPSNRFQAGEIGEKDVISAKGKSVLVIGGGDTGSDCVGTANRQGAKIVRQVEIMPKPPEWKQTWNPSWPAWPNILRTSSSHEEGCERDWSIDTKGFEGEAGGVRNAHLARVEWKRTQGGAPAKPEPVSGSGFTVEADLVLLAMGFLHVRHTRLLEDLGVAFDQRGNITCAPNYATSSPGVFVAGDANTGASLVVRAIFHGREAAKAVDAYLRG
jgi:glutamate synthase (NADPH/NADH) small chain